MEVNHPVDGSPERLCGPRGGAEPRTARPKKLSVPTAPEPDWTWPSGQDKSGRHLRRTRRSLRKRRFVRVLCRGTGRLRRISANREHLGWADAARFLPYRIAKAVKRTIHWMVRPPCLLTFPEGRFASHFYGGLPYTARPLLSLRDISPALWGNLPAPPPGLRCPLRSAPYLCATGARRPLKRRAKLLIFLGCVL